MALTIAYSMLFLATGLYAWILDIRHDRNGVNPDVTVVEVVFGTFICLLAAGNAITYGTGTSAWEGWMYTAGSFLVGGAPIIIWQIARMFYRRGKYEGYTNRKRGGAHAKTSSVADTQDEATE